MLKSYIKTCLRSAAAGAILLACMTTGVQAAVSLHGIAVQKNQFGPCPDNPNLAQAGDEVLVVIRVSNNDDFGDAITVNSITDTLHRTAGDETSPELLPSGPVSLPNKGDSVEVSYTYTVAVGDGPLLTDLATVNYTDQRNNSGGTPQTTTASAPAQITIIAPALTVTKECSFTGTPENPQISFNGVVTNTGDRDLTGVVVNDTTTGQTFPIGDLAQGATGTYSGTYIPTTNPSVNSVTASGFVADTGECFPVSDTATCTVSIPCNPLIAVTKTCTVSGTLGSFVVNYSGTVSNPGNVTLTGVTVQDDQGGAAQNLGDIIAGGSVPYSGSYTLPAGTPCSTEVTDSVTATASYAAICPQALPHTLTASQSATCTTPACPCTPRLAVTKTCTVTGTQGSFVVNYSGTVSNTGDVPLTGVTVQDDKGGAAIVIGTLAVGASAPYTGSYTLPADTACNVAVTDSVSATGTGPDTCQSTTGSHTATATASATCTTPACAAFGCTPGFFKNCTGSWPSCANTGTKLSDIGIVINCPTGCTTFSGSTTLLAALSLKGGSTLCGATETLLRAAAAAYLNQCLYGANYPVTEPVVTLVNGVLSSGCDRASILSLATRLDQANNSGCKDPSTPTKDLRCLR